MNTTQRYSQNIRITFFICDLPGEMPMKKYLAVDAGGTKVAAILYDETFTPIRTARVGSMRSNTTSDELAEKNAASLIEQLGIDSETVIDRVTGIYDSSLIRRIKAVCKLENESSCGELGLGLAASGIFGDGMLALSGTGATMFARYGGSCYYLGGYGASVSDEGSGYWMSRIALDCAIKDFEGRGEKTLLTELVTQHFGRDNLRDAIFSIYSRENVSPASSVASCAPLITKAAEKGDAAAIRILEETGRSLASQLYALMRMNSIPHNIPVTISGSVWRGHELIFNTFSSELKKYDSGISIIVPEFEPIVGGVIAHYYDEKHNFNENEKSEFKKKYSDYLYNIKNKGEPKPC